MQEDIYGLYEKTLYRDSNTGHTLFSVKVQGKIPQRSKWGNIVCTGNIPSYKINTPLKLTGEWEEKDEKYKFVTSHVSEEARDEMSAFLYLSSGAFSGIGPETARKIVRLIGKDVFSIHKDEEKIRKLETIMPQEKAAQIVTSMSQTTIEREIYEFIFPYGGFYNNAIRLYVKYGLKTLEELRKNPYIAIFAGLSFMQCDIMAKDLGLHEASSYRIRAAILHILSKRKDRGDTFVPEEDLLKEAETFFTKEGQKQKIPSSLIANAGIKKNGNALYEQGKVYLKSLYEAEEKTAVELKRLMNEKTPLNYSNDLSKRMEELLGVKYAPEQKYSFNLLRTSGVGIITGGPGTGKTTTVNGLIRAYKEMHPENKVQLCAPTGRAAQRMTESTGQEAVTIHRLLEFLPYEGMTASRNRDNPIEGDLIIVDEVSMLDIELAALFFSAIKSGALLLLVGDVNQLPAVGAGDVLHDLIRSKKIPTCHLKTVYRQAETSSIIVNANRINDGQGDLKTAEDFLQEYKKTPEEVKEKVVSLVEELWDPKDPFKVQVLAPTHKGEAGVQSLNESLQGILNPKVDGSPEIKYGKRIFRIGDKVLLNTNNYEKGYYNGDLGIVKSIVGSTMIIDVLGKDIHITEELFQDVNLADAMTIHKSQGSEFENVIIALPYKPTNMLKRNLLYTAVTRGKKKVFNISEMGATYKAVKETATGIRNTNLVEKMR